MPKPIDQQLVTLNQKDYWVKEQFKAGELRIVHTKGNTPTSGGRKDFEPDDTITVAADDDLGNWVECVTKFGFLKLRRAFVIMYTNKHVDE